MKLVPPSCSQFTHKPFWSWRLMLTCDQYASRLLLVVELLNVMVTVAKGIRQVIREK